MALRPLEERVTRLELGHKEIKSKQESTESRMLTKAVASWRPMLPN